MQGDPKVDELMRPVLVAIERHVKDREAATEIYNRAYEAVMNSMDVKTGKTYCAYCGAEYPLDDAAATLVSEHIKTCEKHPMRAVEARAEAAEAKVAALTAALQAANEALKFAQAYWMQAVDERDKANADAERLASSLENDAYPFPIRRSIDEKDAALRAHRARVGGGK